MLLKIREQMKKKANQKGFTLVELVIVMGILALLTGLAVPKFGTVLADSKYKAHNVNVEMLVKAAQLYLATNGNPTEEKDISDLADADYIESATIKTPYNAAVSYTVTISTTGTITITPGLATQSGTSWDVEDNLVR